MRFFAHIICGTVCRYVIIAQLRCLDSFLVVVVLVGIFSIHRIAGSCGERTFLVLTIVGFLLSMSQPRLTFNSLLAGLFLTSPSAAPSSSAAPVVVTASSSASAKSFSSEIAVAVAYALENSLPAITSAVRENTAPVSSVQPVIAIVDSGHAMVVASSLAASLGTLKLPATVLMFPSVPAITGSNSSRPMAAFTSPVMATHVTGAFSGLDGPILSPSFDKAFVVGPGHAPIPTKLVSKITGGQFVDLADLLSATSDWSQKNLDLCNFHLQISPPVTTQHSSTALSTTVSASWG